MVAVAYARYSISNDNSFIETVVKYSVDDGKTWKTQVAIRTNRATSAFCVVHPTVFVYENKLYILVGKYNKSTRDYRTSHTDAKDWEPFIVVGELTKTTVDGKTTLANITWEEPVSLNYIRSQKINGHKLNQFLGGASGAVVTKSGAFLIPVQVTDEYQNIYCTMICSDDKGKKLRLAKGWVGPGHSEPVVVEFGGKLFMSVRYDYNYCMFYESTDMGETWEEATSTLSRVWGISPNRNQPGSQSSLISVEIENKSVLLFTHPLNTKGAWLCDKLHLWLTDGNRMYDIGQVSVDDENSAYSSLLYKDDKLYCLHEINNDEVYSLVFAKLDGELERIKCVIKAWKQTDGEIEKQKISTNGFVGFLQGKSTDGVWEDEYLCVDATLHKGAEENNDVLFKAGNSWAEWPVSNQGQNQRYHFTNNAFTLAATVIIHKVPENDKSPLLGVVWSSNGTNNFALFYTEQQKWLVTYGSREIFLSTESWVENTEYNVALVFSQGFGYMYVDGKLFKNSDKSVEKPYSEPRFFHFYFAAANETGNTNVEVKNVLLYNRVLNDNQLTALKNIKYVRLDAKTEKDDTLETFDKLSFFNVSVNTDYVVYDNKKENDELQESASVKGVTQRKYENDEDFILITKDMFDNVENGQNAP